MGEGMEEGTGASSSNPPFSTPDVPGEPWPLPAFDGVEWPPTWDDESLTEIDDTSEGVTVQRTDRRLILGALGAVGLLGVATLTLAGGGSSIQGAEVIDDAGNPPSLEATTVPVSGFDHGTGRGERIFTNRPTASVPLPAPTTTTTTTTTTTSTPVASTTSAPAATTTAPPDTAPPLPDEPAVVARPIPVDPPPPPPSAPPPPWAASAFTTQGGHVSTDVGCAADPSTGALDAFFAERIGPVIGWDYQHVYPLGNGRNLWLFQDAFIDHSGTAGTLDRASFAHNAALVQDGTCFRLLHRGSTNAPAPFELGTGTTTRDTWFWPMGGEVHGGKLFVFWAEMRKDPVDPKPPDGLGWHPVATHVGTYDPATLARLDFRRATQGDATPIWGYAVESDDSYTYLFGNTFEQNLAREGGWSNGPHSGTKMYLARVPRGAVFDQPEYWTATGWIGDEPRAEPYLQRHWAEFPMQPRFIDGQWVATAASDGYWGRGFEVDVAKNPWGPWTTVETRQMQPRNADPKMNTYHAHLMPWRDGEGRLVVSVSNNARDMLRDAYPNPHRYRPMVMSAPWKPAPPPATAPPPPPTPTSTPTVPKKMTTTTTAPKKTTTTTTAPKKTTTTTTAPKRTTTTTTAPKKTTTTTTAPKRTKPPKTTVMSTTLPSTTVPPKDSTSKSSGTAPQSAATTPS